MSAFGKKRIDAFFFAHDPHAIFLLVLFAYLAHGITQRKARLKDGRRLKEDSRKGGTNEAQKADKRKRPEAFPTKTREEIPPALNSPPVALNRLHSFPMKFFSLLPCIGEELIGHALKKPFIEPYETSQMKMGNFQATRLYRSFRYDRQETASGNEIT